MVFFWNDQHDFHKTYIIAIMLFFQILRAEFSKILKTISFSVISGTNFLLNFAKLSLNKDS